MFSYDSYSAHIFDFCRLRCYDKKKLINSGKMKFYESISQRIFTLLQVLKTAVTFSLLINP